MGLLDLYNKPADVANNYINRTYTAPKKPTLQDAYNQAMGKSTPSWAYALADAMPSIGQIIASQSIKDEFQQQPVADSLERQKDRQIAYSQAMQDRENQNAKDFVAMAKDQLGMDAAEEERNYNRQIADLNRNEALEARKQAYNQWLANEERKDKEFDLNKASTDADIAYKNAQAAKTNWEMSPGYQEKQNKKANEEKLAKHLEEKRKQDAEKKQKHLDTNVQTAKEFFKAGIIDNKAYTAIQNNPELGDYLLPAPKTVWGKDVSWWLGKDPKKMILQEPKAMSAGAKSIEDFDKTQGY